MYGKPELVIESYRMTPEEEVYVLCDWYSPGKVREIGELPMGDVKSNEDRNDESTRPNDKIFHASARTFIIHYFHGGFPGGAEELYSD